MRKFIAAALSAAALCLSLVSTLSAGAFADNAAPIAENFEFETYRGVSYGGELSALDPDGDKLSFEITTKPRKGSVELSDGGHFVYTPDEGEKGGRLPMYSSGCVDCKKAPYPKGHGALLYL